MVVISNDTGSIDILLGSFEGFADQYGYRTGSNSQCVVVGNFDNDAQLDFVVVNRGASTMSIFRGNAERIEIVKRYAIHQNAAEVARQFQDRYDRAPPARNNILNLVRKFDETGSVEDEPRSGRPRSVSTDENREHIRVAFEESPETSTRRASLGLNLSRTSLRRMMKELGLKPYRPHLLHDLSDDDPDRRCEFADIFLNLVADDSSLCDRIVWADEATFKLNGHVNRHNCVYYAVENPHIVITQDMNALGVTV
ncbi:unnamed protein product [Adineta ricciae]|uniref:DUF4817 domain-containing protein n=1 Tax=Adineta ricciae TaxID=249248 RepID=A0A815PDR3_ADIRI|nr:unnamed protein product [Adineta ricciae]